MASRAKNLAGWCLALLPLTGYAQIYICKDAAGRTITADRQVSECDGRLIREMSREGVLKREIPAPLTPEQKRRRQQDEAERKAELAAVEERRQFDRLLLARYPSESHIELIRQRTLAGLQEKIRLANATIASAGRRPQESGGSLKNYAAQTAETQQKWELAERTILHEQQNIREIEAQINQTNTKFDVALRRYREIGGTPQSATLPPPEPPR